MSIEEKLQTILANVPKVYAAGKQNGNSSISAFVENNILYLMPRVSTSIVNNVLYLRSDSMEETL